MLKAVERMRHAAFLAASVGAGCSSSSEATPTGAVSCADVAIAACQNAERCATELYLGMFGDQATCRSRQEANCNLITASPGGNVTTATLLACAQAGSNCSTSHKSVCDPQPGTLAAAARCVADVQCASLYCSLDANSACGVCKDRVSDGGSCKEAGTKCAVSLVCKGNGVCGAPAPEGADCMIDSDCEEALSCQATKCQRRSGQGEACDGTAGPCVSGLACIAGVCAVPGRLGEHCTAGEAVSCAPGLGLTCDPGSSLCVAETRADLGAPCSPQPNLWCKGGYCSTESGVCSRVPREGEPCPTDLFVGGSLACLIPAVCVQGTCVLPSSGSCK